MAYHYLELSDRWALQLSNEPESGMGYQIATVTLKDGRKFSKMAIIGCTILGERDGRRRIPFLESDIASIIVDHGQEHTIRWRVKRVAGRFKEKFDHAVYGRRWLGERPWDAGMRHIMAFVAAPFTAPAILAVYFANTGMPPETNPMLGASIFAAYFGSFVLGLPIYLLLRARRWTAFWIAPILGFVIGTIMWYATPVLVTMMLGGSWAFSLSSFARPDTLLDALRLAALPGAAVGIVLWLIGRPDRQRR